ncbi:MAG: murein biosynthesis integral membrane protein MurJ [PVC group bacterium]|nr:murein biosynthesis integral membrane protein MurJ [PVC group bacterium]
MKEHKNLFKSAGTIGFFTLMSRILGFLRDVIIAFLFGTSVPAQAFVVAFRIPNTLRNLVGEGATNAAVIPVLSEYLEKGDEKEFWRLTTVLLNIFAVALISLAILGTLLAPFIVRIIAFGFAGDEAKMALTIKLTRLMFSFIVFIGLSSYVMGVLHTLKHFVASAVSSCFLNISMIIFGLFICHRLSEPIMGMAIAVLIGGFLQLAVQIPVLVKKGFRFRFPRHFYHPAAKRIAKLLVPRMVGSSIYQLNIFADTIFASLGSIVGEGAVVALYFGTRLVQFPTGIFGISVATACLPTMSRQAAAKDIEKLKETLLFSLRSILVLLIPSAVGLIVLSLPIVKFVFERGQFDTASAYMTATALMFYSFGLFAYSGVKVTTSCFYALQDTVTPVKITAICVVLNIVLNFVLMKPLRAGGLALATAISSATNFFLLLFFLRRKIGEIHLKRLLKVVLETIVVSAIMGVLCWYTYNFFIGFLPNWASLFIAIIAGIAFFLLTSWRMGILKLKHEADRQGENITG